MAPGGVEPPHTDSKSVALSAELRGPAQRVADGTRTHDHLDHNQGLYRLSYRHRVHGQDSPGFRAPGRWNAACAWEDSNPRPAAERAAALSAELEALAQQGIRAIR